MKVQALPEKYKHYVLVLSNGWEHAVTGETKRNILASKSQFVELEDGNSINKSYIVQFRLDILATTDKFKLLPEQEKKSIIKAVAKQEAI